MDETNKQTGIVVLAAGASKRMQQAKQLLDFQGETFLRRAVLTAIESICNPVIVVLGANLEMMKKEIEDLPFEICFNENWQNGLSSSIKAGVKKLTETNPEISAVVLTLCDQPLVGSDSINRIVEAFYETKKPIVAAEYKNTVGVPALFSRIFFDDLLKLEDDKGAKKFISERQQFLHKIILPEAAFDIDTIEDYENLKNAKFP